jgi:R3H domain
MQLFLNNPDTSGATLQFPATLTSQQRRTVRALAEKLGLSHSSHGVPPDRYILVSRHTPPQTDVQLDPSHSSLPPQDFFPQQSYRAYPTTRASTEHLPSQPIPTHIRSPLSPTPRLRSVASMGNLRSQRTPIRPVDPPPPVPPLPTAPSFDPYDPNSFTSGGYPSPTRLSHHSSQESDFRARSYVFGSSFVGQRQPIGTPLERGGGGFGAISRPPQGLHQGKTASLASGSGGGGSSRGGSELELQVQGHPGQEY